MKTNTVTRTTKETSKLTTHEGASAKKINALQQLRRVTMACMLFEDTFYVDGQSSAVVIQNAVDAVLRTKNGPKKISDLAKEIRSEGKLRHVPLFLTLALVRAGNKDPKLGKECRSYVAETLENVIQRPDELSEFVSLYWKDKKVPLSNQVKKGLAAAFRKFNEYSLSKYANREGAVSLRDVLFLTHPRPTNAEQQKLWNKLAKKELVAPDTWESNLSAGADKKETWTRLLKDNKLGALALLRNLRNMEQSGVDRNLVKDALKTMNTDRVLPFRFISAAKYAPLLEADLEAAMFRSLESLTKLKGKTLLLVDNSGSMHGTPISHKSEIDRREAAIALAILVREVCEESQVVVFGTTAGLVRPRRGFALRDEVLSSRHGGGTNTETAKQLADKEGYDRIIIFTDEQSHQSLSSPLKNTKGYVINVAAYTNGVGYGKWVHVDGFSEAVVDWIQAYEQELETDIPDED